MGGRGSDFDARYDAAVIQGPRIMWRKDSIGERHVGDVAANGVDTAVQRDRRTG
jgi:hypothetical protein